MIVLPLLRHTMIRTGEHLTTVARLLTILATATPEFRPVLLRHTNAASRVPPKRGVRGRLLPAYGAMLPAK
jgi:hypothetical protein